MILARKSLFSVFLGTLGNQSWITYSDLTFDINNTSTFNIKSTRHELLFGLQWLKKYKTYFNV